VFFFVNKKEPKKLCHWCELGICPCNPWPVPAVGSQAHRSRSTPVTKCFWFFLFTKEHSPFPLRHRIGKAIVIPRIVRNQKNLRPPQAGASCCPSPNRCPRCFSSSPAAPTPSWSHRQGGENHHGAARAARRALARRPAHHHARTPAPRREAAARRMASLLGKKRPDRRFRTRLAAAVSAATGSR